MNSYNHQITGWQNVVKDVKTIEINATVILDSIINLPKDEIKMRLCKEIAKEIFNKNLIELMEVPNINNPYEKMYKARLFIPNQRFSTIEMESKKFIYKNREWTDEEIKKALNKTYPQYMI